MAVTTRRAGPPLGRRTSAFWLKRLAWAILAFGVASGCRGGRASAPPTAGESDVIQADELVASNRHNLLDAVRQLRPLWLTPAASRGAEASVAVYLDEQLIGGLTALARLPIDLPARMRYMRPSEAQLRFGSSNGLRPAIVVESPRR